MKFIPSLLVVLTLTACQMQGAPIESSQPVDAGVKAPEGMAASADEMTLTADGRLVLKSDQ